MLEGRCVIFGRGSGSFFAASIILMALVAGGGCSRDSSNTQADARKTAIPVTASAAAKKDMPVQVRVIGNVQPLSTVSVKAQIQGELTGVNFKDGQEVRKGDLLFTIDQRPFEAKLRMAKANLAKDKAQLENAQSQAQRYGSVVGKGYVAQEAYDSVKSNAAALDAAVKADEAAVDSAELELKYCTIRSPINGIAGSVRVTPGNIVKASDNDNPLVTIKQVKPIYATFAVPERYLPEITKFMSERKLEVLAYFPGDEKNSIRGELSFLENEVKSSAGTIQVWATFRNDDKRLWPGQFVNVVLTLTTHKDKTVIPSQAIQMGQSGPYVYVIKQDMSVEYRQVTTGARVEREIVVEEGVLPGEMVITDGQLRLTAGSLVKLVDASEGNGRGGNP